jgi:dipeptidyl aminopeptidase/acylaminoacyl peptidase
MGFRALVWAAAAVWVAISPAAAADPPSSASPAAGAALPIEHFAQLPFVRSPLLSPDGRRIAALIVNEAEERIAVFAPADGGWRIEHSLAAANAPSFQWAGNDRLLIDVDSVTIVAAGPVWLPLPTRRVAGYDLATRTVRTLGTNRGLLDQVIFVDHDGRYALLAGGPVLGRTPHVQRVDLGTFQADVVQPSRPGIWSWFADSGGIVRAGADYGQRRTRIYYRAAAGAPLRLIEDRRHSRDDSVVDSIHFAGNSERGILITNADTGRFAIYHYDFATDARGEAIFEHAQVDVGSALIDRDGNVDGIFYEDDRPRVRWLNPEMAQVQATIDRAFPGKTNMIRSRSRDGNRMLVFSSAADDPGTYYVFDRAARRMELFASPFDGLHEVRFAAVRAVSYRSRDGQAIHGYLTLPPGRTERGLPLVVLPHGGPFARDSWVFDQDVQFLASRGYAVLQPNFRGSTGYGRDFVERGYGQYGGGMIDDIEDGVDWLAGEGTIDRTRVCIMGISYGGYAAIWSAIRSPERYRCTISLAGPSDLKSMRRHWVGGFAPGRYVRAVRDILQGEERIDLDTISPLRQAERLTVPALIGHGETDIVVPPDQSRRLVTALNRRRANVESVFYPKAGHGFTTEEERSDWLRRVEAFLARHNPAEPRPAS